MRRAFRSAIKGDGFVVPSLVYCKLVRSDPRLFEWIDSKSYYEGLRSVVVLIDECVDISGVGRWIENGQRGILVAGGKQRASGQGKRGNHACECELEIR